jgi:hypothetical protein
MNMKNLFHVAEWAEPDEDLDVLCFGLLLEGTLLPEVSGGTEFWVFLVLAVLVLEDDIAKC